MTPAHDSLLKIALYGLPGAGKSTTVTLLAPALEKAGHPVTVVKLAEPLYDIQRAFYQRLDMQLAPGRQDGALLNFLGSHFRRIDSEFLLRDFAARCDTAVSEGTGVLLCDDARPADLDGLVARGFKLVRISAPDAVRRSRKEHRGDRTAGRDDHPTELGGEAVVPDFEVLNEGSLEALEARVGALVEELVGSVR